MKVSHTNNTTQILWQLILSPTQVSRTSPQGNSKPSYLLKWSESHSVVSDSFQSPGVYSPWSTPGQNTGVGSHSRLQGSFPTQGSNPGLPHCRRILYQLSHKESPIMYMCVYKIFVGVSVHITCMCACVWEYVYMSIYIYVHMYIRYTNTYILQCVCSYLWG